MFQSFFRGLLGSRSPSIPRQRSARPFRPQLEWLEDITVPSAVVAGAVSQPPPTLYVNANTHVPVAHQNGTARDPYSSIQAAINAAPDGATIRVAAGTYAENVSIDKPITLLGPNASVNPNTGRLGAAATVEPGLGSSYNESSIFTVTANDVTIEGFTIQGSINGKAKSGQSAAYMLSSGVNTYAAVGVSNSTNVFAGQGSNVTDVSGLTVENNIVKDFTQYGVYGDTSDYAVSNDNTVMDNRISDIPENNYNFNTNTGYSGMGVVFADGMYAQITGNTITNVAGGIQVVNYYLAAGNSADGSAYVPLIDHNNVQASVVGIWDNNQYEQATGYTVSDNTIKQDDPSVSPVYNVGLLVESIQSSVSSPLMGNTVSRFLYGVEFANDTTSSTVTLQGGNLNANTYGVWDTNNDYLYPSTANTSAIVEGVTIANSKDAGIWVDSTSPSMTGSYDTSGTVTLTVEGLTKTVGRTTVTTPTTIIGGPIGLLVDGSLSSASMVNSYVGLNGTGILVENGGALTSAETTNIVHNSNYGVEVTLGSATLTGDRIAYNGVGVLAAGASTVTANDDWWGSNAGPAASGSNSAESMFGATLNDSVWLELQLVVTQAMSGSRHDVFAYMEENTATSPLETYSAVTLPPMTVVFSASGGQLSASSAVLGGEHGNYAEVFFTARSASFDVRASLDHQTDSTNKVTHVGP